MGIIFFKKKREKLDAIPDNLWDIEVVDIDGKKMKLEVFRGYKALIIVNVASSCGLTRTQYKGLVKLHEKYRDQGLEILAFPCNQFMWQEHRCELEIKTFVTKKFGASFKLFAKIQVNGPNCHPLFKYLRAGSILYDPKKKTFQEIPWNFAKFLVNSEGKVLKMYEPPVKPEVIEKELESLLKSSPEQKPEELVKSNSGISSNENFSRNFV